MHIIKLKDRADQKVLYDLEIDLGVDIWQHGMPGQRDAMVMVTPENRIEVLDELDSKGIEHYVHLNDLSK